MAGEFRHKSVGTDLTQAEYEATTAHEVESGAQGDLLYVNASGVLVRLPAGAAGQALQTGGPAANPSWVDSMGQISHTALGADSANVDITSIPATYTHLLLLIAARSDAAADFEDLQIRVNADAGANYDSEKLITAAATTTASEVLAATIGYLGRIPANTADASLFGDGSVFLPAYSGTHKKTWIIQGGCRTGTASGKTYIIQAAGFWSGVAAINRLTITAATGLLKAGTSVTLFGIMG